MAGRVSPPVACILAGLALITSGAMFLADAGFIVTTGVGVALILTGVAGAIDHRQHEGKP